MSSIELVVPDIGTVVRCKAALSGSPKGSSGRVKSVLTGGGGTTVVIQSIWGGEITIPAKEFCRFFEQCDSRDLAWEYWANA